MVIKKEFVINRKKTKNKKDLSMLNDDQKIQPKKEELL